MLSVSELRCLIEVSFELLLAALLLAIAAGTLDTLAGGGGLITVPGQIFLGVPPISALVNNKCSAFAGTTMASWRLYRKGLLDPRAVAFPAGLAFVASLGGAWTLTRSDPAFVAGLIPWVLVAVAGYFAASQFFRLPRFAAPLPAVWLAMALVGFYDGYLGPGTGSLMFAALVLLSTWSMRDATVYVKACNGASNWAALLVFAPSQWVIWPIAVALLVGQLVGGWLGARLVERHAERWAKPLVIAVSLVLAGRLLWTNAA